MSNVTEIVIVLDRSGSMHSIRKATVEGINNFIDEVQKTPGDGFWTLVQFDDWDSCKGRNEHFPNVVFAGVPDKEVRKLTMEDFQPSGSTALIDAVCITIQKVRERVGDDPSKRHKIMFVIVTDGHENASREYKASQLRELTAELESQYGWKFLYLGANQDAFNVAESYIPTSNAFNFMGMQGIVTSGCVGSGQVASRHLNRSALSFDANAGGVAQTFASGAYGARAWKADGNLTALGLLGNAEPENLPDPTGNSGHISVGTIQ